MSCCFLCLLWHSSARQSAIGKKKKKTVLVLHHWIFTRADRNFSHSAFLQAERANYLRPQTKSVGALNLKSSPSSTRWIPQTDLVSSPLTTTRTAYSDLRCCVFSLIGMLSSSFKATLKNLFPLLYLSSRLFSLPVQSLINAWEINDNT